MPTEDDLKEMSMFGVRKAPDGTWKPILQRVETNRCKKCNGFGTYGNPLCGAVYTCSRCQGDGHDPKPTPKPATSLISFPNWLGRWNSR